MMIFRLRYILNFAIIIIYSCANPQPPSGGPPDKTPPTIISSYPAQRALNFQDDYIILEFSEWVSRNSVIENLYISPPIDYDFDWSGTTLKLEFKEELKPNTTYVLSLGTDWSDLKNNKPENDFKLIFSTNENIDNSSIIGKLYGKDVTGAFIYAYKIDDINSDTLNPKHNKPHYKTQIGTSGNFKLLAVKPGKYRLFAIKDTYKDILYSEGVDEFGASPKDIIVLEDSTYNINFKLGPKIDRIKPILYNADCYFNNYLTLNFSEPVDTNSINKNFFIISDSAKNKTIEIIAASINNSSADKVDLIPAEPLDTNILWEIKIAKIDGRTINDTASNPIDDSLNFTYFYSDKLSDITTIKLPKFPFKDSTSSISLTPELRFIFERPIKIKNLNNLAEMFNIDNTKIDIITKLIADRIVSISPKSQLNPDNWYILKLNFSNLCYFNNSCLPDTFLNLHFKTLDDKLTGGAKGIIKNFTIADTNLIVVFFDEKNQFQTTVNDTGYWELKQLPKGNYKVEIFRDINSNRKYDYGEPYPFKHSEPFLIYDSEQIIKPRWTIEIILSKPD